MKNISLKTITAGLLLAFSFGAQAQNQMLTELNDGCTEWYLVSEIRSIKIGAATMIVNRFSGNPATYNIADIAQYYFTDATSTGANASVLVRNLSINPNPASEQLEPTAKRPAAQEKVKVESWKVGKLKVAPNSYSAMVNTNAMSALSLNMLNANY